MPKFSFGSIVSSEPVHPVFPIEIRYFNNRFSWRWEKFTDKKWPVAKILQITRENLGYSGVSRFPEVQFENMAGTGEWYLDTARFQECHSMTSKEANDHLKSCFVNACQEVGEDIGVQFSFEIIDMLQGGEVIEKIDF